MKKLLPLLICYVMTQGQCFAISGGPVYGGGGNVNTIGTYSGTIQGVTETDNADGGTTIPGDPVPGGTSTSTPSNAIGLFDLVVPGVTTATGGFLLFADGVVFGGTITASVDPDSAKLTGILNGSFNFTETSFASGVTANVTAQALGLINAKVTSSGNRAVTAARLTGTASLGVDFGLVDGNNQPIVSRRINFNVVGFQTTTSTATASTIGTAAGTGTGGQTNG